jgi:hypothetical protein
MSNTAKFGQQIKGILEVKVKGLGDSPNSLVYKFQHNLVTTFKQKLYIMTYRSFYMLGFCFPLINVYQ